MIEDKNQHMRGVGDVIEYVTEISGIKYLFKRIYKEDCNCGKRRDKLNEKFPFDPFIHYKDQIIRLKDNDEKK